MPQSLLLTQILCSLCLRQEQKEKQEEERKQITPDYSAYTE